MADNEWTRPIQPPSPLFLGRAERDLVKNINNEVIERIIGQTIVYYPISREHTQYHSVYGEAIRKTFLSPITVQVLVEFEGETTTAIDKFGVDKSFIINVQFHKRRLTEDQNLFVREGDFVQYGELLYEIVSLKEPKQLFGQVEHIMEIAAKCIKAREQTFNAK